MRLRCWRIMWVRQCPKSSGTTFTQSEMTYVEHSPTFRKKNSNFPPKKDFPLKFKFEFLKCRAVFSPSCISHTVLTKKDWQSIRIGDISLPQALRCWELQPYWSVSNHLNSNNNNNNPRMQDNAVVIQEEDEEQVQNLHALKHSHKRYKASGIESK